MLTIAFDQSLANTGWSVLDVESINVIDKGTIKTDNKQEFIERLLYIEDYLKTLVDKYNPNIVFLEEVHCPRNSPYAWPKLLVVESIFKLWLYKHKLHYYSLSPKLNHSNSWRKLLLINSSSKVSTKELFKPVKMNEHVADSIAINLAGNIMLNELYLEDIKFNELIK